ncbi:MAG: hypothetical protein JXQ90_18535 [Cyclobacteriaceae bacterium]
MKYRISLLSRSRLYGQSLVLAILQLSLALFVSQYVYNEYQGSATYVILALIVVAMTLITLSFAFILERLGTHKRLMLLIYILVILMLLVGASPLFNMDFLGDYKPIVFSLFHVFLFGLEALLFVRILADIFQSHETEADHIWGAILCYFMILYMFGELYEVITLFNPTYLGAVFEMGLPNYVNCIVYSLNTLSGLDSLYPDAHGMMKRIASLESVIGNLFLVVVLGRLLSHPVNFKKTV